MGVGFRPPPEPKGHGWPSIYIGRTSENPLSKKFAERPFHALGCIRAESESGAAPLLGGLLAPGPPGRLRASSRGPFFAPAATRLLKRPTLVCAG